MAAEEAKAPNDARLALYLRERRHLLRLAYRFVGSVSEAEDIVQDAWLRFAAAGEIADPRRYLLRIVTNLGIDRLRATRKRRETYVGPWLPEPYIDDSKPDEPISGDTDLDISFGVMRALERLSPQERAVLFLHDLYGIPFDEVASTLMRSPATCRQLASRARKKLRQERRRFVAREADVARYVAGFSLSMQSGDIEPLRKILADDCEFVSDGGGKAITALNVITGRDAVSRFMFGIARKYADPARRSVMPASINGGAGLVVVIDGEIAQATGFDIDDNGDICAIYAIRNPDKLARLSAAYLKAGERCSPCGSG